MRTKLAVFVLLLLAVPAASAAPDPPSTRTALPAHAVLLQQRAEFLRLAKDGVRRTRAHFWNARLGWYNDRLDLDWRPGMPLARLWTAYPLFETLNAIALAEPSRANRAAVRAFADKARDYWNPEIIPAGGYSYLPRTRTPDVNAFFDDAGWWGLAFLHAAQATGDRRYLRDAARAFHWIVDDGWEDGEGGVWWDTDRHHKTAEPLAAAILIGAKLYRETRNETYLRDVRKLLTWADTWTVHDETRLYQRSSTDSVLMNYVQGMMIEAHLELCAISGTSYCRRAKQLAQASAERFPADAEWAPPNDAIYLSSMLALYRHDGNPRWYGLAHRNALRAIRNARGRHGLYLKRWDRVGVPGGLLRMHAATLSLFAWLAATPPPRAVVRAK